MTDPLILTVTLDPLSQAYFDQLRQRYFPASRNVLHAHVTMFHHLPGEQHDAIVAHIEDACRSMPPSPVSVTGLRFLGHGTAYALMMPAVATVRRGLATHWAPWLTAQDRQSWHPHVTVQNKVAAAEAKRVHAELLAGYAAFEVQATGLHLWQYQGGPWLTLSHHAFAGGSTSQA